MLIIPATIHDLYAITSGVFANTLLAAPYAERRSMVSTTIPFAGSKWSASWLQDLPAMRKWEGSKQVKNLEASFYTLTPEPYELSVAVDRHELADAQSMADAAFGPSQIARQQANEMDVWKTRLVANAFTNADTTVGPDGEFYVDTDHTGAQSNKLSTGGGAQKWWLADLKHGINPILFLEREAPHMLPPPSLDNSDNRDRRKIRFDIEARATTGYSFWQLVVQSQATPDKTGIDAAWDAMAGFTNENGDVLGLEPTHIIFGRANRKTVRDTIKAERDASGASNTLFDTITPIYLPFLP